MLDIIRYSPSYSFSKKNREGTLLIVHMVESYALLKFGGAKSHSIIEYGSVHQNVPKSGLPRAENWVDADVKGSVS